MLLARDGQALASIVIDPEAGEVEQFAAAELQSYLERITGCRFQVKRTRSRPERPSIVVARSHTPLGVSANAVGPVDQPEAFAISIISDGVWILGSDERGVLYGVYAFLEDDCGVAWLAPAAGNEVVPTCTTLEVGAGSRAEVPSWPIRMAAPIPKTVKNVEGFRQFIDFAAKLRLNSFMLFVGHFRGTHAAEPWDDVRAELLPEFRKRGLWLDIGHHSWDYFINPAEYFGRHPEWFSLINGVRVSNRQLCLAGDSVLQEFEANVRSYLRGHPEVSVLSLFPNDVGGRFCECDNCRELEPEEAALGVVNRIAEAMEGEFPSLKFGHLTYTSWGGMLAPRIRPRPNVILYWAAWTHCYVHGYYSPRCNVNRPFRISLDEWRKSWPNEVVIYDYHTTTNHSTNMLIPFARLMGEDIRALRERGFEGYQTIFSQVENWWTYALNFWLFGKLTWNPKRDPHQLMADWVRAAYPSTGGAVLDVYRKLEEIGRYEAHYHRVDIVERISTGGRSGLVELGSVAEMDDILGALKDCEEQVGALRASARGHLERDYLRRLDLILRYSGHRYRHLRGFIKSLQALGEAQRPGTSATARGTLLSTVRECMAEMDAAAGQAARMLDDPAVDIEGVLHREYVRNWAEPRPGARTRFMTREIIENGLAKISNSVSAE